MTNEYNPDGKEIRFIDSHYKDLFHIPDGSCVQIHYPDETVVKPCTFIDEYHRKVAIVFPKGKLAASVRTEVSLGLVLYCTAAERAFADRIGFLRIRCFLLWKQPVQISRLEISCKIASSPLGSSLRLHFCNSLVGVMAW